MAEPESTWRVWTGAALLSAAPLPPALAEQHRREDEREREAATRLKEQRGAGGG